MLCPLVPHWTHCGTQVFPDPQLLFISQFMQGIYSMPMTNTSHQKMFLQMLLQKTFSFDKLKHQAYFNCSSQKSVNLSEMAALKTFGKTLNITYTAS